MWWCQYRRRSLAENLQMKTSPVIILGSKQLELWGPQRNSCFKIFQVYWSRVTAWQEWLRESEGGLAAREKGTFELTVCSKVSMSEMFLRTCLCDNKETCKWKPYSVRGFDQRRTVTQRYRDNSTNTMILLTWTLNSLNHPDWIIKVWPVAGKLLTVSTTWLWSASWLIHHL